MGFDEWLAFVDGNFESYQKKVIYLFEIE